MMSIVQQDPAVQNVVGYTGVGSGGGYAQINTGNVFVSLKPLSDRKMSVDQVIARLRPKLAQVSGGRLYLAAIQDLRAGGRQSNAQYQYTLQSEDVQELYEWTPKLVDALEHNRILTDVSSDQQQRGLETYLDIDRDTTARLGITPAANRQYALRRLRSASSVRHLQRHQSVSRGDGDRPALYAVSGFVARRLCVRSPELRPRGLRRPTHQAERLLRQQRTEPLPPLSRCLYCGARRVFIDRHHQAQRLRTSANAAAARNASINALANTGHGSTSVGAAVSTTQETMIPLAAVTHYRPSHTPLSVNHQGLFVASTMSFNLQPGKSLGEAAEEINAAIARIHMPTTIRGTLAGTAQLFPAVAVEGADSDPHCHCRRLYPSRRALRELRSSDHDPFDFAVGRRWCARNIDGVPHGIRHYRTDRRHSLDRHRQEERDHDDRLRHRSEACAQLELLRCDFRSLSASASSDLDDDLGGNSRRDTAGAELRQRRRDTPAARYRDRRRACHQSNPDALHDASAVSLSRPRSANGGRAFGRNCHDRNYPAPDAQPAE